MPSDPMPSDPIPSDPMPADALPWTHLAADGFAFPDGVAQARVADELARLLVSPDPEVRDDLAYSAMATWVRDGRLDDVLDRLGDAATDRLSHPQVQARTFAPLVHAAVLRRTVAVGGLPRPTVERWFEAFAAWYPAEPDTRGWDDTLGWLHAVAHGADAAAAFATALPDARGDVLTLCARRFTAPEVTYRYVQGEDPRLARAITEVLLSSGMTMQESTDWLAVVEEAVAAGAPGPVPPWAFNTFATLQSLHLHLTRGMSAGGVPTHGAAVADRVAAVLRVPLGWLA